MANKTDGSYTVKCGGTFMNSTAYVKQNGVGHVVDSVVVVVVYNHNITGAVCQPAESTPCGGASYAGLGR